jgi:hypothetical protein
MLLKTPMPASWAFNHPVYMISYVQMKLMAPPLMARLLAESAAAAKSVVGMAVVRLLEAKTLAGEPVMHQVAGIAEHVGALHTAV